MRSKRFRGTEYAKVLRPTGKRDRFGDQEGLSEHTVGPCSIAWSTAWASIKEVVKFPINATDRDVTLYFDHLPDIQADDFMELTNSGSTTRYRVVALEPWLKRSNGEPFGMTVRISGIETGDN